jgi:hypothetical protein
MKTAFVILGYESSGSVFTAKVVSHVVGKCAQFGDWNGYGFNGAIGDDLVVLNRSIPWGRPKSWYDEPSQLLDQFSGYEVRPIICTRDLSISQLSRMRRFGGSAAEFAADSRRATAFFTRLLHQTPCFLFSYETMLALGPAYFQLLYAWLGVTSGFAPDIENGNARYVQADPT